ncbi:uncharacterized protein LOC109606588 [Aethina tumida]|uniref:uncharacterized protein LOC109606588 n=1 Tax=Aethina tumida TaxID=116153 RepID=UPI00096B521A|nr:uncharacterized protein LOC109606588 [Aethina tumida]
MAEDKIGVPHFDKLDDYVSACETAEDMWISLLSVYERKDTASKMCAIQSFHKYKFDGGGMASHIAKIENLAKQCKLQSHTIDDTTLMCKIVRRELRANKEPLEALVVSKKSVGKVEKKIANGERQKRNVKCYKCQNFEHFAREWRSKKKHYDRHFNSGGVTFNVEEGVILSANSDDAWLADSGASFHMTSHREWFSKFKLVSQAMNLPDKSVIEVKGEGAVPIEVYLNGKFNKATLTNVKFIPGLSKNLFSIGAASTLGIFTMVQGDKMLFSLNGNVVTNIIRHSNNTYRMLARVPITIEANIVEDDFKLWHERETVKLGLLKDIKLPEKGEFVCEACIYGKSKRRSFKSSEKTYI